LRICHELVQARRAVQSILIRLYKIRRLPANIAKIAALVLRLRPRVMSDLHRADWLPARRDRHGG
jgi:hypothetical protein